MRILAEDLVGLAEALDAGALTSIALVERALRRYAETEPQIHAFAWLEPARAQRLAKESDDRRRSGGVAGPLEGIPIGVHFLAGFGDEATLFRLAAQLEAASPWSARRPPIR